MAKKIDDQAPLQKTADGLEVGQVTPDPKTSAATMDRPSTDRKPEIGGPKGPEPTRYGDWEKGGRCIDF